MLLDVVYVGVVILLDLVFQEEGGLQGFVPQDEEVELELEDVAIGILQLDGPLVVLALVILFDARLHYKKTGSEEMSKKTSMLMRVMSTMMSKKIRYN